MAISGALTTTNINIKLSIIVAECMDYLRSEWQSLLVAKSLLFRSFLYVDKLNTEYLFLFRSHL